MLPIVWASLVAGSECVVRVQDNVASEVVQRSTSVVDDRRDELHQLTIIASASHKSTIPAVTTASGLRYSERMSGHAQGL